MLLRGIFMVLCGSLITLSACTETRVVPATPPNPAMDPMEIHREILQQAAEVEQTGPAETEQIAMAGDAAVSASQIAEEESEQPQELHPGVIWVQQSALMATPSLGGSWKAALTRGARLSVVKESRTQNGFLRVVLSDQTSGFVSETDVLLGDVEDLLAFENSPVYEQPDSRYPPKALLSIGTQLFALGTENEWVEVLLPSGELGWMLNTDLAREADELSAARS